MKRTLILSLLASAAVLSLSAQGFKDGVEYYRADQPEEAEIIINNNINDAGTDKATAYYYLGQIALQRKNTAKAQEFFNKGIQADEKNGYNYVGLGTLALMNGNASEADKEFKLAKKNAKKNADIITEIARAYYNADPVKYAKDITKYVADAKKADKTSPSPFILEGDMLAKTNVGDAAGYYEMAATFDQEQAHPEAYVKYARTYFQVNPEFAINKLNELLALQPNSALAQRELAEKYYDNNQLTMAAEQYGKYIQNPNSFKRDKQRYAGLLFFAKKYNESYDVANQILQSDPTNFYMQRIKFYDKKALGEKDAALADAEALFANPKAELNSQDYLQYGDLLTEVDRIDDAIVAYESALKIAPDKIDLYKSISDAYYNKKDFVKAAENLQTYVDKMREKIAKEEEAHKTNPDIEVEQLNVNDLFNLSRFYMSIAQQNMGEDGDQALFNTAIAKGRALIDEVAAINRHPSVLNSRSDLLRLANKGAVNQEVADADLETLKELDSDPTNLEKRKAMYRGIYLRLGEYYQKQKDIAQAKEYYEKAYSVDPMPELRTFIDKLK